MSTWSSRTERRNPGARRSHTIHMPAPHITKVSGAWGALTGVFGLLAFTVQSVTLIVLALVSLVGLVVTTFGGERVAVQTRRASTEKRKSPGSKPARRSTTQKPGTPTKARKCSVRCRKSSKPAASCNCSCRGSSHGSESGAQASATPPSKPKLPTKSQLRSKRSRQHERQVVRQQRKATP
jgi:hypothetical protein